MALELNGTTGVSLVQDGVVTAADLNSTLDLTGKTVTLPAASSGFNLLSAVDSTSAVSSIDISLDYDNYINFFMCMYIVGSSSSTGENLDMVYKRDGESTFDTTAIYGCQNILVDTATAIRNENGTNTSVELFTTNSPSDGWVSNIWLNGFGSSNQGNLFHHMTSKGTYVGAPSTIVGGGGYDTGTPTSTSKIIEVRISFTSGDVAECRYQLYGMKS